MCKRVVTSLLQVGAMHNDTHKLRESAHGFIVKFSPSTCVAVVASLTREVAVRSFACDVHETDPAIVHGRDKTLIQQCMLAQARPR